MLLTEQRPAAFNKRRAPRFAIVCAVLAVLTACSSGGTSSTGGPAPSGSQSSTQDHAKFLSTLLAHIKTQQNIRKLLPKDLQAGGKLNIGTLASAGLPLSIVSGSTQTGISPDLAYAIGKVLGVNVKVTGTTFAALIPGLQSGRFDIVTQVLSDTSERRKIITLIDIAYDAGYSFLVKKDGPYKSLSYETACGLNIGTDNGGTGETILQEVSKKCQAKGKKPITLHLFNSPSDALVSLASGRDDADFNNTASQLYVAKQNNSLAAVKTSTSAQGYYALGLAKDSKLETPVRRAMLYLNDAGFWKQILQYYGIQSIAPSKQVILNTKPFALDSPH